MKSRQCVRAPVPSQTCMWLYEYFFGVNNSMFVWFSAISEEETSEMRLRRLNSMCQELGINQGQNLGKAINFASHYTLRHIMVDGKHNIVYCILPKAGCTTLIGLMMMIASGSNVSTSTRWTEGDVHDKQKHRTMNLTYLSEYTKNGQQTRLDTYFKFMIVRNPFGLSLQRWTQAFKHSATNCGREGYWRHAYKRHYK